MKKWKPQISPLRYAPVEMTILFEHRIYAFSAEVRGTADPSASLRDDKGRGSGSTESGCWAEAFLNHFP
jgi:hypothetical protein